MQPLSGSERRDTPGVTLDMLPLPTTAGIPPTGTTTPGTDTTGITGTGGTGTSTDMMTRSTLDEVGSLVIIKFFTHSSYQEDPESSTAAATQS